MIYSIERLKGVFGSLEWEEPKYKVHSKLIRSIESLIKVEEIKQVYPKNMFINDDKIEFYTFTDKHVLITKSDKNKGFIFNKVLKIDDVESFEKVEKNEYEPSSLKIYFYNDEEITFNSDSDTNEAHLRNFNKVIDEIANLLTERA